MKPSREIEAALLDQERRVLAASPSDIDGLAPNRECKGCGGKLRRHNRSNFCSKPECSRLRMQARRSENGQIVSEKAYCKGGCGKRRLRSQVSSVWACYPCRRLHGIGRW